jgi:hypothetical protein
LTPGGQAWLRDVFLPFYDALTPEAQMAYCDRWNAPSPWVSLFLHPELDELFADHDEAESGHRVEPINYRRLFGVQE